MDMQEKKETGLKILRLEYIDEVENRINKEIEQITLQVEDFDIKVEEVIKFTVDKSPIISKKEIIDKKLSELKETVEDEQNGLKVQLKQKISVKESIVAEENRNIQLYDALVSDNKTLEKLSPGERGALLLIFYLLLDLRDIPLVIDQPEDNLDNQSVASILVPFIQAAKKRRQIILVTHNPNLAVVADSDQIVHVKINKEERNLVEVKSGGIENTEINDSIVTILEGTMLSFRKRDEKYIDK